MTGEFWIANSREKLDNCKAHIEAEWEKHKWLKIQITSSKGRSLDQNGLSFELYTRIGNTLYAGDIDHARYECKLRIGVPLLRENDEKFRQMYDEVVKGHDYETKLQIMEYLPVTRIMSKKVFSQYVDKVIDTYTLKGVDFSELAA